MNVSGERSFNASCATVSNVPNDPAVLSALDAQIQEAKQ